MHFRRVHGTTKRTERKLNRVKGLLKRYLIMLNTRHFLQILELVAPCERIDVTILTMPAQQTNE